MTFMLFRLEDLLVLDGCLMAGVVACHLFVTAVTKAYNSQSAGIDVL